LFPEEDAFQKKTQRQTSLPQSDCSRKAIQECAVSS
jgi:hypothetical protein